MEKLLTKVANKISYEASTRIVGPVLSPFRKGGIVVFHIGRSGSTVLCDLLNQHPDIYWDREVYEKILPQPWHQAVTEVPLKNIAYDPLQYIQKRTKRAGKKYYGCEVKFFHLEFLDLNKESFITFLEQSGFDNFIILERKNYLRAITSSIILHKNGVIQRKVGEKNKIKKISVDLNNVTIDRSSKSLIEFLTTFKTDFEELKTLLSGKNYLYLTYENEIEKSPLIGYEKVCQFLEIQKRDPVVMRKKMNPFPLTEIILNFNEVCENLRGTEFEWMLYS